jgi:hypothetical protein
LHTTGTLSRVFVVVTDTRGRVCVLVTGLYDDFTWYFQYASSAYSDFCGKPNGGVLIEMLSFWALDSAAF